MIVETDKLCHPDVKNSAKTAKKRSFSSLMTFLMWFRETLKRECRVVTKQTDHHHRHVGHHRLTMLKWRACLSNLKQMCLPFVSNLGRWSTKSFHVSRLRRVMLNSLLNTWSRTHMQDTTLYFKLQNPVESENLDLKGLLCIKTYCLQRIATAVDFDSNDNLIHNSDEFAVYLPCTSLSSFF